MYIIPVELYTNQTSKAIYEFLPIKSTVSTWGYEISFDTGIKAPISDMTTDVSVEDIAYWSEGKCLCIFSSKTPISTTEKPVPASPVVIIGKIDTSPKNLKKVPSGARISAESVNKL